MGRDAPEPHGPVPAATEKPPFSRAEGDRLWLVDRAHLVTGSPEFVAPNADKPHRHNDGSRVAERRQRLREENA